MMRSLIIGLILVLVGLQLVEGVQIHNFRVEPTILWGREDGVLKQMVRVSLDNSGEAGSGELEWGVVKKIGMRKLEIGVGHQLYWVGVPAVRKPALVKLRLRAGGKLFKAETTVKPARKWLVYVAPSVHTDIGYTDVQDRVVVLHNNNTEKAIEACKEIPGFKWNLEVAWQGQNFLRDKAEKAGEFLKLAKEQKIGIQGLYLNMLTGLCSHEELNRIGYFAGKLRREYGIPIESAMLTDVPTSVWSLPMVLARSGIKYFAEGINQTRGPFFRYSTLANLPFWWEGPDGSKVLTWFTPGYAQAWGLLESYERLYGELPGFLAGYERPDYPYDAVFVYGAFGDNQPLNPKFGEVAAEWNSKWEYPRIIISTNAEFFKYVEGKFVDKIPTFRGDGGCFWEDGAASSAYETGLNRRTHSEVVTAEELHSIVAMVNPGYKYPLKEFNALWDKILLYDEHTWGAAGSISEPEAEMTKRQWEIKSGFARAAAEEVAKLLGEGAGNLLAEIKSGDKPLIVVFNPLAWRRADLVEVQLANELALLRGQFSLVDSTNQEEVVYQALGPNGICFVAKDLPSLGYKRYEIAKGRAAVEGYKAVQFFEDGIENRFYRVKFDPVTGGVVSIYDKELKKELVDQTSAYKLNQLIYASGGEGTQAFSSPKGVKITPGLNGPIFGSMKIEGSMELIPKLKYWVVLYDSLKRIDIVNEFNKTATYNKEALYFAFPFNFKQPEFKLAIPNGVLRPEVDQLKGACKDWYCVQNWVSVSEPGYGVVWSSPDTPLVSLGDINVGKWLDKLELNNGSIFAYVMNNYWFTNYKASQGGDFRFRYSISSDKGEILNWRATRFDGEVSQGVLAKLVPANQAGKLAGEEVSFCEVDKPEVVVLTVKGAEDEDGFVVRLLNTDSKDVKVYLRLPYLKFKEAWLCNLLEEKLFRLTVNGQQVQVPVDANGVATVRVK